MLIYDVMKGIYRNYRNFMRDCFITNNYRKRLKNRDFSIISSDCTGGVWYHELHQKFMSPTINMFMEADDFIRFCKDIKYWIDVPMEKVEQEEFPYPVAMLGEGGIKLHLVHYKSVEEAQNKWDERKKRINWDNMYFVTNDRNYCSEEFIKEFNELPFKHKVILSHIPKPNNSSVYYIRGFENEECIGVTTSFRTPISLRKNFDEFDYVRWLNEI